MGSSSSFVCSANHHGSTADWISIGLLRISSLSPYTSRRSARNASRIVLATATGESGCFFFGFAGFRWSCRSGGRGCGSYSSHTSTWLIIAMLVAAIIICGSFILPFLIFSNRRFGWDACTVSTVLRDFFGGGGGVHHGTGISCWVTVTCRLWRKPTPYSICHPESDCTGRIGSSVDPALPPSWLGDSTCSGPMKCSRARR